MPSEPVRFDLSKDAIEDIATLAGAAKSLPRIVAAAAKVGPQVGTQAVAKRIAKEVGISVAELRPILMALLNFYHSQVRLKLDTKETADAITVNLRRILKTSNDEERLRAWEDARDIIIEAVSLLYPDHPLEAANKAFRVANARQYELVGMRIYTDARPVFNEAGDTILQMIISHVLSLDYHDGHDHHVAQFNLDALDVTELKELCERAEQKARVLKRDLGKMNWPTSVFREPSDKNSGNQ